MNVLLNAVSNSWSSAKKFRRKPTDLSDEEQFEEIRRLLRRRFTLWIIAYFAVALIVGGTLWLASKQLWTVRSELSQSQDDVRRVNGQIAQGQVELADVQAQIAQKQAELAEVQTERDSLNQDNRGLWTAAPSATRPY
jgi:septal ring factor EnvC (AmiA/AmiB activator)